MGANTKQKLFREKSMEAIESPESMNDYLQVTSPGVWLVLAAILLVLVGAIIWSVFGRINTSVRVAVISEEDNTKCLVPYDKLESVMTSGIVAVDGQEYTLQLNQDTQTVIISEQSNPYVRVAGDFQIGDVAVEIPINAMLPNGIYKGSILTESLQPITLLIQ